MCLLDGLTSLVESFGGTSLPSTLSPYSDGNCINRVGTGTYQIVHSGTANRFCGVLSVNDMTPCGMLTIDSAGFVRDPRLVIYFQVADSAYRSVEFQLNDAMLKLNVNSTTTTELATLTYDPAAHRYWRYRMDTGADVVFETSPDAIAWTTRASAAPPFAGNVHLNFGAGFVNTGTATTVSLPGLNAP